MSTLDSGSLHLPEHSQYFDVPSSETESPGHELALDKFFLEEPSRPYVELGVCTDYPEV